MCAVACVACDAAFDHWRLLAQVVLPSRHQLAHPFALVVLAITGAHFESSSSSSSSSSNADAVSRVVDASLLAPLLVFASLPATGTQAQQVCTLCVYLLPCPTQRTRTNVFICLLRAVVYLCAAAHEEHQVCVCVCVCACVRARECVPVLA